jgi:hypothetical protein
MNGRVALEAAQASEKRSFRQLAQLMLHILATGEHHVGELK